MPTYRFVVVDPEKYRAFQVWSYRLHPEYAARAASAPLVPVGYLHGAGTDKLLDAALAAHGLKAEEVAE
jgi:hypothetical protein